MYSTFSHPTMCSISRIEMTPNGNGEIEMEAGEMTLGEWLDTVGWKVKSRALPGMFLMILDLLQALAERQIFHGDLHINNIVVVGGSGCPTVRVIDFGLTGLENDYHPMAVCSETFRAPEVKEKGEFGSAIDVWSFGGVVIRALLGVIDIRPFRFLDENPDRSHPLTNKRWRRYLRGEIREAMAQITDPRQSALVQKFVDLGFMGLTLDENLRPTANELLDMFFPEEKVHPLHPLFDGPEIDDFPTVEKWVEKLCPGTMKTVTRKKMVKWISYHLFCDALSTKIESGITGSGKKKREFYAELIKFSSLISYRFRPF